MPCKESLQTVRTEITAAQARASDCARTAKACLAAGADSTEAERALLRELDGLNLLRAKEQALYLFEPYIRSAA